MKLRLALSSIALAFLACSTSNAQLLHSFGDHGNYQQPAFRNVSGDISLGGGARRGEWRSAAAGRPGRLWFSSNTADRGLGYEGSYLTLGGKNRIVEDRFEGRWLFESNLHHSIEDDGGFFANFGLERIFSIDAAQADVAVSLWYDYDDDTQADFGHTFHQVGASAAIKTPKWDLVGNGYFPVGNDLYTFGDLTGANCFVGNNIVLVPGIDSALEGFDVTLRSRPERLAIVNGTIDIGGYQYSSDVINSFAGGRFRFGFQAFRGMMVSAEVNHDDRFDTTGVLSVGWLFGANASGHGHEYSMGGRDLERTVRNDHVLRYTQEIELAIDPDTGVAYNVLHVDNTAAAGGAGTFESRFMTLAEAEAAGAPDDVIFVFEGDGTSTGYDEGIVLQDRQMLLGDGVEHSIPLFGGGDFLLCNDVDGAKPTLVHDGGDIVTLADDNVVAGLILDGLDPADSGIVGTTVSGSTVIRDNMILNMEVDGLRIDSLSGDLAVTGNMFTNIQGDAIQIGDVTSTGGTITFADNTIDDIEGNGIKIGTETNVVGFSAENDWLFSGNMITNIGPVLPTDGVGYGIALVNGADAIGGVGGMFAFDSNTIDATTNDGIKIDNVVDPEAVFAFSGNTITGSGTNALGFCDSLGTLTFDGDTFSGAAEAGFFYEVSSGGSESLVLSGLTVTGNEIGAVINVREGTDLTAMIDDNLIDGNTSHGIQFNVFDNVIGNRTTLDLASFAGNTVSNNGGRGLEINGGLDTVFDDVGNVINAVIVENRFENNALGGMVAQTFGGEMNMTIGGVDRPEPLEGVKPPFPENQFVDNGEVGIGLIYSGDAVGTFNIEENIVTGTTDTAVVTPFEGDGIHVRLAGNTEAVNSAPPSGADANIPADPLSTISGNLVGSLTDPALGNAGDGIEVFTEDETVIEALEIAMNVSANNGLNGLRVEANDSSIITGLMIEENIFNSNGSMGTDIDDINGVQITATDSADIDSTTDPLGLHRNMINDNTGSGVGLRVTSDASIAFDISENEIDGNGADGITLTEDANLPTDTRSIGGTWDDNMITNNGGHGINSAANTSALEVTTNIIEANGLFGVNITGSGDADYVSNLIMGNGTSAGARGTTGGVNIEGDTSKELLFADNVIYNNTGDGMRIVRNGALVDVGTFVIDVDGNTIEANSDRGVSVLNQGDQLSTVGIDLRLNENKIASNGDEGILIMNTSSTTQSIDQDIDPSNDDDFAADGDIDAFTRMTLEITDNLVINNGADNDHPSNGLVLLVGTNDGGYDYDDDGGFFDDTAFDGSIHGGVGAVVTGNIFTGNAGEGALIRSFVSTIDPPNTGADTLWEDQNDDDDTNDTFDPRGYEGDPLARLDLVWGSNTYDTPSLITLTLVGASYSNDESTFKSRTIVGPDNDTDIAVDDDPGIFLSGTRDRNAQRLAARNVGLGGTQLDPDLQIVTPFGDSDLFLYAGLGQSTFRLINVVGVTDSRADLEAQGFILDDPYVDIDDANGISPAGSQPRPEDMPFGWNYFDDNALTPRPQ